MTQPVLPFSVASDLEVGPTSGSTITLVGPAPPRSSTTFVRPSLRSGDPVQFVRHAWARRYVVRVRANGTVRVTIPRWGSKREAEAFAVSQRAWIEKQLARVALDDSREEVAAEDLRELRARAVRELPPQLLDLAAEHGLAVSRVSVRNQQWRWGSCSPNGHICLNWRLVQMPAWVRDYVMIHELMHLKQMDHSPKFWKLVERACPGYREARAWLRAHQGLLARSLNTEDTKDTPS